MSPFFDSFKEVLIVKVIIGIIALLFSFSSFSQTKTIEVPVYKPVDLKLYKKIVALDSVYFNAYNTCDMKKQASMYSEDIEFFHDISGLATSKQEIIKSIKKNICGKVTRNLVPGSIEVYPIPDYGAVEMGFHSFYDAKQPNTEVAANRFIIVWKKLEKNWQITKVISLH